MINPFIDLWVGSQYRVSELCCILFGLIMYSSIVFPCLSVARNAKGLYKESKRFTVLQSVLNLVITIALVPRFGILGALIGTIIARLFITIPCNYFLVDKMVFPNYKSRKYELFGCVAITLAIIFLLKVTINMTTSMFIKNSILLFFVNTFICTLISTVIAFIYFYFTDVSFSYLIKRIKSSFRHKNI